MFVIIPAKPFEQSKTRLSPALSLKQRINLSRQLLLRTIRLARQVGQVVVISRGGAVRHLAKQAGAWALVESGADLNSALRQASDWAVGRGGQTALILPADLPLLTLANLTEIIKLGQQTPSVVIAPCHRTNGTNALLLRPPTVINLAFGPDSFKNHQQIAQKSGLEPIIYHSPTIALDLDFLEDLEKIYSARSQSNILKARE